MEYYSTIKNEILPFATAWMDLESIMLSEISQLEKDKYCVISLICGMFFKIIINEQIKQSKNKHIDIENRLVVTRGEWVGLRGKWVKGVNCMVPDGN